MYLLSIIISLELCCNLSCEKFIVAITIYQCNHENCSCTLKLVFLCRVTAIHNGRKFYYWIFILLLVLLLPFLLGIPMLIHRGLHGEYGFDVHGFSILTIGIIPFICVFLLRGNQFRLPLSGLCVLATVLVTGMVLHYLSSNGLWSAQHPSVTREMCAKLRRFALFVSTSNFHSCMVADYG